MTWGIFGTPNLALQSIARPNYGRNALALKNQNESTTHLDIGPALEAFLDCSLVDSPSIQYANTKEQFVKRPSIYLKMKVLGAIDIAPGKTRDQRVRNVAAMTFLDDEGNQCQFTWRTIQTWYYRYKNHAKGKIERFFRRVRDQFLIRNLDLSSIEVLNKQFTHWVEQDYNATVHSTLGMKPIDRFGVDLSRIRFLTPSQDTDELFYAEATRTVKKDNTFSFQGDRYETPVDLRGKEVHVRYERLRQGAVIVYDNGRRLGQARLLDAVANGLARRREQ